MNRSDFTFNGMLARARAKWRDLDRYGLVRSFMEHISSFQKRNARVCSAQGGANKPPLGDRRKYNAKRTARAEAPSGRNRQRSTHCPHCDRRDRRDNIAATSEAQQRFGWGESPRGEHHAREAQGDCSKGRSGKVGMMPFDFSSSDWLGEAYLHTITIDPNEAATAWLQLSQNQWAAEYENLPRILHSALLKTLTERRLSLIGK